MWSFEQLVFTTLISGYATVSLIRLISPWFKTLLHFPVGILITVQMVPEIETQIYVASVIVFAITFILASFVSLLLRKRYSRFEKGISFFNRIALIYLLITPQLSIFTIDKIQIVVLILSITFEILLRNFVKIPVNFLEIMAGFVSVRWLLKPMVKFDVGATEFPTIVEYMLYGLSVLEYILIAIAGALLYRTSRLVHEIAESISITIWSRILLFCISLSLLFLMTKARAPVDIYFTMIPAYHIVSGGTPLVDVMSQYGLLFLAPWVVWLLLFPNLPVSYQIGSIITCLLLVGYFVFLLRIGAVLFKNRLIYVSTIVAFYYFSILIRYYSFPDPYSLVSAPAFSPLRFGIFIIPLYFLVSSFTKNEKRNYRYFLLVSAALFFYSFEVGVGLILAGMCISLIHACITPGRWMKHILSDGLLFLSGLSGVAGIFCATIWLQSGQFPDFQQYWSFAITFGSGFLALPIAGQTGVFLIIAVTLYGFFVGMHQLIVRHERIGYSFVYLAVVSLVQIPYYMGRSVYPTLYNISLAFILLCGILSEYHLMRLRNRNPSIGLFFAVFICGFVLFIGAMKGAAVIVRTVISTPTVLAQSFGYIKQAVTVWDILQTQEFQFVHTHLPAGCPFVAFDSHEFPLLPALRAYPAFQYGFMRGFVMSKNQIDTLLPQQNTKYICLFVNRAFVQSPDELMSGVILYFWRRYGDRAERIAVDEVRGFSLYRIPSDSFIAK